jgi:hypothetical protein
MHVALWALSAVSLLGAFVCLLRPSHEATQAEAQAAAGTPALAEGSHGAGA